MLRMIPRTRSNAYATVIVGRREPSGDWLGFRKDRAWLWTARLYDMTLDWIEERTRLQQAGKWDLDPDWVPEVQILVGVRFPVLDYTDVLDALRQHNAATSCAEDELSAPQ
jgi:hypothetical protein